MKTINAAVGLLCCGSFLPLCNHKCYQIYLSDHAGSLKEKVALGELLVQRVPKCHLYFNLKMSYEMLQPSSTLLGRKIRTMPPSPLLHCHCRPSSSFLLGLSPNVSKLKEENNLLGASWKLLPQAKGWAEACPAGNLPLHSRSHLDELHLTFCEPAHLSSSVNSFSHTHLFLWPVWGRWPWDDNTQPTYPDDDYYDYNIYHVYYKVDAPLR